MTKVTIPIEKIKITVEASTWKTGGWEVSYGHDLMNEDQTTFVPFARVCEYFGANDNAQLSCDGRKVDVQDYIEAIGVSSLNDHLTDIINADQERTEYYAKRLDHVLPNIFESIAAIARPANHS